MGASEEDFDAVHKRSGLSADEGAVVGASGQLGLCDLCGVLLVSDALALHAVVLGGHCLLGCLLACFEL